MPNPCNILLGTEPLERCQEPRPFTKGGYWPMCRGHADQWREDSRLAAERGEREFSYDEWTAWMQGPH